VLRSLSLCTCCRHYPGTATGDIASLISPQSCQPSLIWPSGRPVHRPFRGLLGVHSRYGLHTRAVTVYRDQLSEGFSHFVTSMTAPVASGWSGCRVGLAPTGKRRLCTAHAKSGLMHRSKIHLERFPVGMNRDSQAGWKRRFLRGDSSFRSTRWASLIHWICVPELLRR